MHIVVAPRSREYSSISLVYAIHWIHLELDFRSAIRPPAGDVVYKSQCALYQPNFLLNSKQIHSILIAIERRINGRQLIIKAYIGNYKRVLPRPMNFLFGACPV